LAVYGHHQVSLRLHTWEENNTTNRQGEEPTYVDLHTWNKNNTTNRKGEEATVKGAYMITTPI
jgi:hypothetical protein